MDWNELFTTATATEFAIGAIVGAVVYGSFFLFRDRELIEHRWQRRKRIQQGDLTVYSEPEEYEGYISNPVPDEERSHWPWYMLSAAASCGLGWLAFTNDSDIILIALTAVAALPNIVTALAPKKQVELIEGGASPTEDRRLFERAGLVGGSLFAVFFAVLYWLDDDIMTAFSIEPGTFFVGTTTLLAFSTLGFAAWRARIGPPEDADLFDVDEYQRETFIAGVTGSVILMVAVLIWVF